LKDPFSIAASVKLRPDDYMLSPSCAPADDATRGSRFSSRSASGRLMMGLEGWGGDNLNRALAANQRQERGTLRTHPIRRPREDIFLPKQNGLSPLKLRFCCVLRWGFRQLQEPRRCPCASGTRYHRPTSGEESRPDAWRPRRSLDASRVAERRARPTPSATTISWCG
jgi:hypothetical protein